MPGALHRVFLVAPLIPTLALLPACTRTSAESTAWIPFSQADFVTIDRSTEYVLVRNPDTDVIIFESENRYGGEPIDRLTWIIEIDAGTPLQSPVNVGPGQPARGWVLEAIAGYPTHAAPLRGTVSITHRTADEIAAIVNVSAIADLPTAGEAMPDRARLARRVECPRRVPSTIGAMELETRAGTETLYDDESQYRNKLIEEDF